MMLNEGFLSQLFPKAAMTTLNGVEGWFIGEDFFPKSVIEDTIVDGHFERIGMDNLSENIIK
jgi:hypothetical protein